MNKRIIFISALVITTFLMISCVSAEGLFDFFANDDGTSGDEEELLNIIADVRQKLRAEKQYDLSDEIRDKLVSLGIEVSD